MKQWPDNFAPTAESCPRAVGPIELEYRSDFRREAGNESLRQLALMRPWLKPGLTAAQLETELAEYPGSLCLPVAEDSGESDVLLARIKRLLAVGPVLGLVVIGIGLLLTVSPPPVLWRYFGYWGIETLSLTFLLGGGVIQFGSIYSWRWIVARAMQRRLCCSRRQLRPSHDYRPRVVSIEDPATFHISKAMGDDTGLLFFEPRGRRIRIETMRYRHFIRIQDLERLEHVRFRTSSAVLLGYRVGEVPVGLIVARSEKWVRTLVFPVRSSLLGPLKRFAIENRPLPANSWPG